MTMFASIRLKGSGLGRCSGQPSATLHSRTAPDVISNLRAFGSTYGRTNFSSDLKDKVLLEIAFLAGGARQKLEPGLHPLRHVSVDGDGAVHSNGHHHGHRALFALLEGGARIRRFGVSAAFGAGHLDDRAG